MKSCKVDGRQVSLDRVGCDVPAFGGWRKLVTAFRLGTATFGNTQFTLCFFQTKSGSREDAVNSPGGTWALTEHEALSLGVFVA